jgi:hypothetical protein
MGRIHRWPTLRVLVIAIATLFASFHGEDSASAARWRNRQTRKCCCAPAQATHTVAFKDYHAVCRDCGWKGAKHADYTSAKADRQSHQNSTGHTWIEIHATHVPTSQWQAICTQGDITFPVRSTKAAAEKDARDHWAATGGPDINTPGHTVVVLEIK